MYVNDSPFASNPDPTPKRLYEVTYELTPEACRAVGRTDPFIEQVICAPSDGSATSWAIGHAIGDQMPRNTFVTVARFWPMIVTNVGHVEGSSMRSIVVEDYLSNVFCGMPSEWLDATPAKHLYWGCAAVERFNRCSGKPALFEPSA